MKNVVITGGGTGGHLAVARAVKEELNSRGIKPVFIGSSNGQDRAWFGDDDGFSEKYFFDTRGVVNKGRLGKILSLLAIIKFAFLCFGIFRKHNIASIFSVGGYSAAPASFASIIFRKKLYIHEQNAHVGSLNRLLRKYSVAFFSSYEKDSPVKDYPIKNIFFSSAHTRSEVKKVIFLGGSQGASAINEFAMSVAKELNDRGIELIHQIGKNEYEKISIFYTENSIKCEFFDFTDEMHQKIADADFAVSRSGASTLWELTANGVPSLFIPYPHAAGDHQYHNAKFLEDQSLCFVLRQSELSKKKFFEYLESDIQNVSKGLINCITNDGAKKIVDYILK